MEKQLTITELSAYLPYGVKANFTRRMFERNNVDLMGLTIAYNESCKEHFIMKSDVTYGLNHIQLLLRNLSDLTTEIEHNGEKFVPIVELAKMDSECKNVDFTINEYGNCIGRLNVGVVVVFQIDDEIPFIKEIHNNIFGQVSGNEFDDMHLSSILPSEIRAKLHEWHFDLYSLIEKGLAIDIKEAKDA